MTKALITQAGPLGPFQAVETLADRYRCDGVEYPFSVIGEAQVVAADTVAWPEPPAPVKTAAEKLAAANAHCELLLSGVRAAYPPGEVMSWDKQEAEARAYLADPDAATPLVDALAVTRGIGKAELVTRIIAKADVFAAFSGACIGNRQRIEDALAAAITDAEVAAVDETAGWPA